MSKFTNLAEVAPGKPATGESPEVGPTYRVKYYADREWPSLKGISNLKQLFEMAAEKYGDCPCLGERPVADGQAQDFQFMTYAEVAMQVSAIGSGYWQLGVRPQGKIGVFGANCKEWMIAMQAMNRYNMVCVPIYESFGEGAVEYILNHSEARLVVSAAGKLGALAKALPKAAQVVTAGVVYWGNAKEDDKKAVQDLGVPLYSWEDLTAKGKANEAFPVDPRPEDLCTIMYTSGTTGDPKGVTIKHDAVIKMIASMLDFLAQFGEAVTSDDVFLSYLPLAHIFDRVLEELFLHIGGRIGYWQGDVKKLTDDIKALQPTVFAGVPRVYERVYNGIQDKINKGGLLKRLVFNWAYERKLYYMKQGYKHDEASYISDMLAFKQVKDALGGRVRCLLTGSAPIPRHVEEFLRVVMCAPLLQGYGLTETIAVSFMNYPHAWDHISTVGCPAPITQFRLRAVPEMGYCPSNSTPQGEILISSPSMFSGYYNNDDMTKEAIDEDGFFCTGDIGEIREDGVLRIIDRKKNIFKLSHGEYIAVEKVENIYKSCSLVEQLWVYGNSAEYSLVAVVVPREGPVMSWAQDQGIQGSFQEVCQDPRTKQYVLQQLDATAKAGKLKTIEQVRAVYLETEPFTVENDMLTPSFKLKRGPLQKKYQKQIDAMYAQLKQSVPGTK